MGEWYFGSVYENIILKFTVESSDEHLQEGFRIRRGIS
jgi:hypothetical protein